VAFFYEERMMRGMRSFLKVCLVGVLLGLGGLLQAQVFYPGPRGGPAQVQPEKLVVFNESGKSADVFFQASLFVVFYQEGLPWAMGVDAVLLNLADESVFYRTGEPLKAVRVEIFTRDTDDAQWVPVAMTPQGKALLDLPDDENQPPLEIAPGERYQTTTPDLMRAFALPNADLFRIRLTFRYTKDFENYQPVQAEFIFSQAQLQEGIARAADQREARQRPAPRPR